MVSEFKEFVSRGNVLDLAVGVVIGGAFGAIVTSLVTDIIMPPIGMMLSGVDFSSIVTTLKAAGPDGKGAVTINWGKFLDAVVRFLIVAAAIFMVVRLVNKMRKPAEAPAPAGPSAQEVLLGEIRDLLKK
ncbi:MAG: large-conductance mechanosensitive channel protein MscL [Bacteroidetes bacterium]|nr:large-conductance mechanosensitive channel protein MscL [Bacteroidota bacterium]